MRGRWTSGIFALPLAACAGNESPSLPPNSPPIFTSATSVSVVENSSGPVYLASATDVENDPLVFTISGGPDAARFTMASSGAIQFVTPPNFDAPADADKDNVYVIELTANDGRNTAQRMVEIKVTNSTEGVSVHRVATGLTDLLSIAAVPGDTSKLFLVKRGGIYLFDPVTGARTLVMAPPPPPVPPPITGQQDIVSFVPAADYQTSHAFYAGVKQIDHGGIRYYTPKPDGSYTFVTVQGLGFDAQPWFGVGPDGYVYINIPPFSSADSSGPGSVSAAIQRFARNSPISYGPAPGNPYLVSGGDPRVFDYGIPNVSSATFYNGYLIFIDSSELNFVSLTNGGLSFGWPYFEGITRKREGGPASVVDPVMLLPEYSNETGGVIAAFVYTGPIASLSGKYVMVTSRGKLRTIDMSLLVPGQLAPTQIETRDNDFIPDVGTLDGVKSGTMDDAGNVWLVTAIGELYVMRAS